MGHPLIDASAEERQSVFLDVAAQKSLRTDMVEKDFWVCRVLQLLFTNSGLASHFLFKGGTSLAKAHNVISRFSEDIDLLLDIRTVADKGISDAASKNAANKLKHQVQRNSAPYIANEIIPELEKSLDQACSMEIDPENPCNVYINYPGIFKDGQTYLRPNVKLEIGAIAEGTPFENAMFQPYAAEVYPQFALPEVSIPTVAVCRTFWEKITALHYANHRKDLSRLSRHYYDIFMIAKSAMKQDVLSQSDLFRKIVDFDKWYYPAQGVDYQTLTTQTVNLRPNAETEAALRKDYAAMADMIFGELPQWDEIIATLSKLETEIHGL